MLLKHNGVLLSVSPLNRDLTFCAALTKTSFHLSHFIHIIFIITMIIVALKRLIFCSTYTLTVKKHVDVNLVLSFTELLKQPVFLIKSSNTFFWFLIFPCGFIAMAMGNN